MAHGVRLSQDGRRCLIGCESEHQEPLTFQYGASTPTEIRRSYIMVSLTESEITSLCWMRYAIEQSQVCGETETVLILTWSITRLFPTGQRSVNPWDYLPRVLRRYPHQVGTNPSPPVFPDASFQEGKLSYLTTFLQIPCH